MNVLTPEMIERMEELCRKFGVVKLELFGSACTPEFDSDRSDMDFLVEFAPSADLGRWLSHFFDFKNSLEQTLGRDVDLVMPLALNNPYFRCKAISSVRLLKCLKSLNDVDEACKVIQLATAGRTVIDYETDRILRSAIQHNFQVIGEAFKRISMLDSALAATVPNFHSIISFRNVMAQVDYSRTWKIAQEDIPVLRNKVSQLINETVAANPALLPSASPEFTKDVNQQSP